MAGSTDLAPESALDEALVVLGPLERLDLDRYRVAGSYVRFDAQLRDSLHEFRQMVVETYTAHNRVPRNFLLWGAPGSGKSYLVQQVAATLSEGVTFVDLNLARLDEAGFRAALASAWALPKPVLCLVDEVDARGDQTWPYEVLLPYLEPPEPRPHATCFCLAGSGGRDLADFRRSIGARPKGTDLLSRIPSGHDCVVAALGVSDKILVSAMQLALAAQEEQREVREIEKFALYFISVHSGFSTARQLRSVAAQSATRIPPGEDRIRYDYLFRAGDPENKEFWTRHRAARERLAGEFVRVDLGVPPTGGRARGIVRAVGPRTTRGDGGAAPRVAVLPFTNISPDPNDEYFADGLTEELISAISAIKKLDVISRTSIIRFKNPSIPVADIGRELGVASLLEGSVRKAGDRVRISAKLIEIDSDRPLWSASYDRDLTDILALQSEIARRVAEALEVQLAPAPEPTRNVDARARAEAYTLYLRGRYYWNRATVPWLKRALETFDEALQRDPGFAKAHAGIADSYLLLGRRGDRPAKEVYPQAVDHARRALALDPELAEPHAALGAIRQEYEWKWVEAEEEFRRALELNPSHSTARSWYALFLGHVGRFDEAIAEAERAIELDPLSPRIATSAGEEYIFGRLYDRAIEVAERALEIDPGYGPAHAYVAQALVQQGQYDEAVRRFDRAGELLGAQATAGRKAHALAKAGDRAGATRFLEDLKAPPEQRSSANPFLRPTSYTSLEIGLVYLGLGEIERSLDWFERARDERVPEVVHFKCEPIYDAVQGEPRFRSIVASVGFPR